MERDPDLYTYDNCRVTNGKIVNGEWKYEYKNA